MRKATVEYKKYFNDSIRKFVAYINKDYEEDVNKTTTASLNNYIIQNYTPTPGIIQNPPTPTPKETPVIEPETQDQLSEKSVSKVKGGKKIKKDTGSERKKSQSELLKNITKNYGKACSKFASGGDGLPFLKKHITDEEEIKEFQEYIKSNAEHIKNIPFFRESILVMPHDPPKIAKFKGVFKTLCEIFVAKYAVKWIFSSKQLLNRRGHLSYRRKILRRIQDPENFVNLNN